MVETGLDPARWLEPDIDGFGPVVAVTDGDAWLLRTTGNMHRNDVTSIIIRSDTIRRVRSDLPDLDAVLASAAELQRVVPGAVLVGGTAVALRVGHRQSADHDHVLADLGERFETVLDNLEALGEWSTAKAQPGRIILGSLGGIESGVRQLRRRRPLEIEEVPVDDRVLTVPTVSEILRIKGWLIVSRNQTRDHLDVAALADHLGAPEAARILSEIDEYYEDLNTADDPVATQLVRQLADPRPRDATVTRQLASYRGLDPRWHDWDAVCAVLRAVARVMVLPS